MKKFKKQITDFIESNPLTDESVCYGYLIGLEKLLKVFDEMGIEVVWYNNKFVNYEAKIKIKESLYYFRMSYFYGDWSITKI